ncbi:hypothetical protein A176_002394 [Myxococcus hansupus]|uniref:Uncharacterized protein n=1 Tax=Pseudomyxococcus hansupus TaxID=1297742 RepID=A0A0H4XBZ4_9BACT|nr:hypothetical protein A176_002394 [Myxococcus hansupus]
MTLFTGLDRLIDTELGPFREGVEPLLEQVRQGLSALHPPPGGQQLPPQQQEAQRARLEQLLDKLEDVLEALQCAARIRRQRGATSSPRGR